MTEADIKGLVERVAEEAAQRAVKETLLKLGVDSDDPLEVQRDFQHLREWRTSINTVKKQGLVTAVGIITAGILGAAWLAFKGPPPT